MSFPLLVSDIFVGNEKCSVSLVSKTFANLFDHLEFEVITKNDFSFLSQDERTFLNHKLRGTFNKNSASSVVQNHGGCHLAIAVEWNFENLEASLIFV